MGILQVVVPNIIVASISRALMRSDTVCLPKLKCVRNSFMLTYHLSVFFCVTYFLYLAIASAAALEADSSATSSIIV